jgi:hypothetical protein
MQKLADEFLAANPSKSPQQAFSKVYTARENAELREAVKAEEMGVDAPVPPVHHYILDAGAPDA